MIKQIFMAIAMLVVTVGSVAAQNGAKVEGKHGGNASAGHKQVSVNGKKGGKAKIDKHGMEIKNKNGKGLEIKGKK